MSLHKGIDTVAFICQGVYTKTYGSENQANINNLYASYGLLEDAPDVEITLILKFGGFAQGFVQGVTNFFRKILPLGGGHIGRE